MIRKRFLVPGGRRGISWLHRFLLVGALVWAWQVIALDRANTYKNSVSGRGEVFQGTEPMMPLSAPLDFEATAYCDHGITKSGALTTPGIAAADPSILPLGSLIFVENSHYRGIFRILDTGRLVKGRIVDIYMTRYDRAVDFGRQPVRVSILRYRASTPGALRTAN